MSEHHHGFILSVLSGATGTAGVVALWFVKNIQVIDAVGYFILLCVSIPGAIIGWRKVRK